MGEDILNYDRRSINALKPKADAIKRKFSGLLSFIFFVLVLIALFN